MPISKHRYSTIILMLTIVVVLTGCTRSQGEVIKGKYWEGIIVKSELIPRKNDDHEMWTATRELVRRIEPALLAYIQAYGKKPNADPFINQHLSEYKLQYWGYYRDGRKILMISFNHLSRVKDGSWKEPFGVLGGGHYYFTVTYDAEKDAFTQLMINADA